jgi:hypothetical protein
VPVEVPTICRPALVGPALRRAVMVSTGKPWSAYCGAQFAVQGCSKEGEPPLTKGKDGVKGHDITDNDGPGSFSEESRKIFYEETAGVDYKRPCKVGALGRVSDYWHVMQSPSQFVILAKTPKAARGKQIAPGSDGGAEGKKGSPVERREDTEGGGRGYSTKRRGKGKAPDLKGVEKEREESAGSGQRNKTNGGRKRKATDVEEGGGVKKKAKKELPPWNSSPEGMEAVGRYEGDYNMWVLEAVSVIVPSLKRIRNISHDTLMSVGVARSFVLMDSMGGAENTLAFRSVLLSQGLDIDANPFLDTVELLRCGKAKASKRMLEGEEGTGDEAVVKARKTNAQLWEKMMNHDVVEGETIGHTGGVEKGRRAKESIWGAGWDE